MNTHPIPDRCWQKSSHSNGGDANCLEAALHLPGTVPVRDSKDPGQAWLSFTPTAWAAFLAEVRGVTEPAVPATTPQ